MAGLDNLSTGRLENLQAFAGAAQGAGIRGVFFWMFGYEDTGTWGALHQVLPAGPPAPAATAAAAGDPPGCWP